MDDAPLFSSSLQSLSLELSSSSLLLLWLWPLAAPNSVGAGVGATRIGAGVVAGADPKREDDETTVDEALSTGVGSTGDALSTGVGADAGAGGAPNNNDDSFDSCASLLVLTGAVGFSSTASDENDTATPLVSGPKSESGSESFGATGCCGSGTDDQATRLGGVSSTREADASPNSADDADDSDPSTVLLGDTATEPATASVGAALNSDVGASGSACVDTAVGSSTPDKIGPPIIYSTPPDPHQVRPY